MLPTGPQKDCEDYSRTHINSEDLIRQARQILPELGYQTTLPNLIPILERNLALKRLERYLHHSPNRTFQSYLHRLARTYQAEADHILGLQNGDTQAQVALWKHLMDRAYRYLLRHRVPPCQAQEQANDTAQDTWRDIITDKATYPFDINFDAWNTTVLYNRIKKAYTNKRDRLDQNETLWLDAEPANWHDRIPDPVVSRIPHEPELEQAISQALHSLSSEQQEAVTLFYLYDLSAKEAAAKAGCTCGGRQQPLPSRLLQYAPALSGGRFGFIRSVTPVPNVNQRRPL